MRGHPWWRYARSLTGLLRQCATTGSAACSGEYPTAGSLDCLRSVVATTLKQGFRHNSIPSASTVAGNARATQATQHTASRNRSDLLHTASTTHSKPNGDVLSYLAEQGFTAPQLEALQKQYSTVTKLDVDAQVKPLLEYFQQLGLDNSHVAKLVGKLPRVLSFSVSDKLQPVVSWLHQQGVDKSKIGSILEKCPQLFGCSIENNLQPTVEWLQHHGVGRSKIGSILEKCPQLFSVSIENNLQPTVEWLVQQGVRRSKIGSMLEKCPQLFGCSIENNLQPTVEWLQHHGVDRSKIGSMLENRPQLFGYSIESNLQPTLDHLIGLGLKSQYIHKVFQSSIMGFAIESINTKCDVLRHTYGLPEAFIRSMLNTQPTLLQYNVLANFNSYIAAGFKRDEIRRMVMNYTMALKFNVNNSTYKPKLHLEVAQYKIQDIAENPRLLMPSFKIIESRWMVVVQKGSMRHPTPGEFTRLLR